MQYDELVKSILLEIDNDSFIPDKSFPELTRDKLIKVLRDCEQQGYLAHSSAKQPLLIVYYDGYDLHPTTYVTRIGRQFIKGIDNESAQGNSYTFNGSVSGANIGDHGTINNHYGASLADVRSFIEQIDNADDKQEASEMVKIIEEETIKPGLLKRFDNLLVKYPGLAKASGQVLLSIATGQLAN